MLRPLDVLDSSTRRQRKGHILLISGEYPPMSGGVGAYTQELGRALVARNWRVSVVTSILGASPVPDAAITVYPQRTKWGWRMPREVARLAAEIKADWLHVQYQTAAYGMHPAINFAPQMWRRWRLQVAWTYHDLLVPYLFPKAGDRLRRWVTERPAHASQVTIVTNEGDRMALAGKVEPLARIPIGSNIHTQTFTPDQRRAQRAHYGFGESSTVVGYFGFLNQSKGGLVLVEAVAQLAAHLPDVRLLMIGEHVGASDPTNYAYLQRVEAAIAARGLGDRVVWTGRQPDEVVSVALDACDMLLIPYLDGASLRRGTLMAALAQGCAIVTTTPQAPLPELAHEEELLYVPPDDAAAAAAALLRLAQEPDLATRLRRQAQVAGGAFSWTSIAAAHEQLYLSKEPLGTERHRDGA